MPHSSSMPSALAAIYHAPFTPGSSHPVTCPQGSNVHLRPRFLQHGVEGQDPTDTGQPYNETPSSEIRDVGVDGLYPSRRGCMLQHMW